MLNQTSNQGRAFSIQQNDETNNVRVVLDHRKECGDGSSKALFGETNTIWCSRAGVVEVSVASEDAAAFLFDIKPTALFDSRTDYIVSHLQYKPDPRRPGGKAYEVFELLLGKMPLWASFPQAWFDWVRDEAVYQSAIDHIKQKLPLFSLQVSHALNARSKQEMIESWLIIGDYAASAQGRKFQRIELLRNESWTSVLAMPLKIAKRLQGWVPPVAEPRYESPDRSGRVLVASPEGQADMLRSFMS